MSLTEPEQSLRWYLVRHGITLWNREARMQGHTDIPLAPEGIEQATRAGRRLASGARPPEAIWSSDLSRARQTAEEIARPLGLTVKSTPLLRETRLGTWEGLTRAEIVARGEGELFELYRRDSLRHRPPQSEPLEEVWERMTGIATEIRREHPSGNVAIVGHGGSLRVLICEALGAPIEAMRRLWLDNASLSIVDFIGSPDNAVVRVLRVNDTSHLPSEDGMAGE